MSKQNKILILVFFLFSILLVSSYIIIENILFSKQAQVIALENGVKKTQERALVFNNFISKSKNLLFAIKDLSTFKQYLKKQNNTKEIEELFVTFAKVDTNIMQLRYIDKNGFEKIRVDRDNPNKKPFLQKPNQLQNKSNRYYFTNSILQQPNQVWYSKLDLNVEHGKVQIPFTPTLRAILPLKKNGRFNGILIVNLFMKNFLKTLLNMPLYDSIIANTNGDILIHYDQTKSWGSYKKIHYRLKNQFPNHFADILTKNLYKSKQLVSRKISDNLILILQLSKKYEAIQKNETYKRYILVAILTIILSFFLSILVVYILKIRLKIIKKKLNLSIDEISHIAHLGFWKYNKKKEQLTWYKGLYKIFDIDDTTKKITFNQFLSYIDEEDRDAVIKEYKDSLKEKRKYFIKYKIKSAKGTIKYVEDRAVHTFDKKGNYIKTEGNIYDITKITLLQKEQLEQQKILLNQSKLASMGEMIANIAHQWRQPLSVISTAATGMKLQKEYNNLPDEFFYTTCDNINENAQYLSRTIDDFRNFIKGDSKPIRFDLKNGTDSFLKLIDSSIKKYNLKVILTLEESIHLQGYPNELIQCFINIFNNAKDALVTNKDENERYIFISQKIVDNTVIIQFKDNGGGIPEDILPKIFEPYFTTKHQSQGTGLGLHMSYNIITKSMHGSIEANNLSFDFNHKNYYGAQFTIILPFK